ERYPRISHIESLAELELRASYDFIWAFGVLMHLEDHDIEAALGFVARHLRADGRFYANVHLGDGRLGAWAGFPVVARPLDWYRARAYEAGPHRRRTRAPLRARPRVGRPQLRFPVHAPLP